MALMTACPQCNAHFKIVADQLRLHNGLVRCGSCQIVFDASKSLKPLPPDPPEVLSEPVAQAWQDKPAVQALMQSLKEQQKTANPQAAVKAVESLQTQQVPNKVVAHYPVTQQPPKPEVFRDQFTPKSNVVNAPDHYDQYSNTQFHAVFEQEQRRAIEEQTPKRPILRAMVYMLCLTLALAAAIQSMVFWRYDVAEMVPQSKPLLVTLCQKLFCTLEPARTLQPLVLDALSLKRLSALDNLSEPASYEMVATVRNSGSLIVEAPVIELALTNAQSQTIARRVLTLDELGKPSSANKPAVIEPLQDWNIKLLLMLDPQTVGFTGRLVLAP